MHDTSSVLEICAVDRSKNLLSTLLACCINALPAILLLILLLLLSRDEDYVLFALSFLFISTFCCRTDGSWTRQKLFHGFLMSTSLAWFVALAVLACLAMTPLYLGRDNGDGTNGIVEVVLMVILFTLTYTPLILVVGATASFVASRFHSAPASG